MRGTPELTSTFGGGLVLVDEDLRVLSFTPPAVRLFSLIEADVGHEIVGIPTSAHVAGLAGLLDDAVASGVSGVVEAHGDDLDFVVQVVPCAPGAAVVVVDVTELARAGRTSGRAHDDLARITGAVDVVLWSRDADGRLLFVNDAVETVYGVSRARALEDPDLLAAAVHPGDRERHASARSTLRWQVDHRIQRPDGEVRWVDERATTVQGPHGPLVVGTVVDVTGRRAVADLARSRDAVLQALLTTEVFGVVVLDPDGRILEANATFAALVGHDRADLVGAPLALLGEPATSLDAGEPAAATQLRLVDRSGAVHQTMAVRTPLAMVGGESAGSVLMVHDETRLRRLGQDLERRGRYDDHTGLMTRGYFRTRLSEALEDGAAAALLWIDLDGFKEINDRYGHRAGDEVLSAVAARLQSVARRHDLVARLGGDEFAVLVAGTTRQDQVENVAERVLEAVRMPISLTDSVVFLSASVGIAVSPEDGLVPDDLMHNADTAMYSAKADGHDRHAYFRREMNAVAEGRAALRQHLAVAVRERTFLLHYQPIVDLVSGTTVAVEALLRWQRGGETVAAEDFIALAEDTGQLRVLGRIANDLVTTDMVLMDESIGTAGLRTAINLSASELGERDFVDRLLRWDVPGGFERLIIEITESVALERGSRAYDTLLLLRRLGATLSIDDFGTGYSNLSVLDSLRPALIKIDRTLVERSIYAGPRSTDLLVATVSMIHALGAQVVLEGVETHVEEELARSLGVDLVQGYGIAPPMAVGDLAGWVVQHPTSPAEPLPAE
ncbi:MAG: EAL domain-containing protein [Nocardioidaceae bacterium]|nr:EAL domain-containing protein [Nocardioidaceae bacterium]